MCEVNNFKIDLDGIRDTFKFSETGLTNKQGVKYKLLPYAANEKTLVSEFSGVVGAFSRIICNKDLKDEFEVENFINDVADRISDYQDDLSKEYFKDIVRTMFIDNDNLVDFDIKTINYISSTSSDEKIANFLYSTLFDENIKSNISKYYDRKIDNIMYKIVLDSLPELREKEIPFLVIEPAKGEYRLEFEKYARVYSTNVNFGTLLQINPFKFNSEGILVNEHIDRLVEIFNVCWPMYAAMPAVLKEAIEKSYVAAGWDLSTSTNSINEALFPCFSDVLKQLYNVINQSDFSQEVKSNYIGSLVTRVKSLTNGILGQVFSNGDMGDEKLFSDYTIIDLSRIGSIETKAMIMGILVMRMQEYHMTYSSPTNELRHITVLEEAHNLLKRTSTEQSSESSNLLGKSVEMIANAIAEMRTYGEGFIIADQSPGLMDMSVIRNTNTKIILSLPDYSDRELVGKSVGLNDEQIVELAKLGQGVAAVYQNKWIAPVLCAIKKYEIDKDKSEVIKTNKTDLSKIIFDNKVLKAKFADTILNDKIDELDNLRIDILDYPMHVDIKLLLLEHLYSNKKFSRQEKISVIYDLYFTEKIKGVFEETELSLKLSDNINLEMKEYLYSKWVNALDIPNGILDNELLGIINIILYKMKVDNITQTEQCERFLSNIYTGRGY